MLPQRSSQLTRALSCWNWKCALLSATVRSLVYLAAMARSGPHARLAVVLVEVAYVTLTAGVYAGMQQKALSLRSRRLGDVVVVIVVPGLSQFLDWLTHRVTGEPATGKATLAVCCFAAISAVFHLHVMRNGVFLTGHGLSLLDDFRRMPRLIAGFVLRPAAFLAAMSSHPDRAMESEATL